MALAPAACSSTNDTPDAGHDAAPAQDVTDAAQPVDAVDAVDVAVDSGPADTGAVDVATDTGPADTGASDAASGGCHANSDCASNEYCAKPAGACDGAGACTARPDVCGDVGMVCGCDGMPYFSACDAATHGVNVRADGDCP